MIEKLNAKLADIQRQKEQAIANYNALLGAEQMLKQLIAEEQAQDAPTGEDNHAEQP